MKNFFSLLSSSRDVTPSFFVLPPKSYRLYRYTHWALCAPHTNVLHCPLVIHYRSATTESVRLFFCFPFHRHRTKDVPEYQNNLNLGMLFFPEEIIQVLIKEKKRQRKKCPFLFLLQLFIFPCTSTIQPDGKHAHARAHTHTQRVMHTHLQQRSVDFFLFLSHHRKPTVLQGLGLCGLGCSSFMVHTQIICWSTHVECVCMRMWVSMCVCVAWRQSRESSREETQVEEVHICLWLLVLICQHGI